MMLFPAVLVICSFGSYACNFLEYLSPLLVLIAPLFAEHQAADSLSQLSWQSFNLKDEVEVPSLAPASSASIHQQAPSSKPVHRVCCHPTHVVVRCLCQLYTFIYI